MKKDKPKLLEIKRAINECDNDLILAAEKLKITLRRLLTYISGNKFLRQQQDQHRLNTKYLAESMLQEAVKNKESWAVQFVLKREEEKVIRGNEAYNITEMNDHEIVLHARKWSSEQ